MQNDKRLESAQCHFLPIRYRPNFYRFDLLNKTFDAWSKCWKEVSETTNYEFNENDFFTKDCVLSLTTSQGEVFGCLLITFNHFDNICSTKTNFIKRFNKPYQEFLKARQLKNVISLEYLTVPKEFRRHPKVSVSRTLTYLGYRYMENTEFSAALVQTRDDVKVYKVCNELGGTQVSKTKINGLDGSFFVFEKSQLRPPEDPYLKMYVDSLWSKTQDFTGHISDQIERKAIA